ncbi:LacI family DNA-binding transcriptional regulator [Pantoea sp. 18069]|uniref:LacI family DNA-binding transcriptional regulator n=1 Tax=Pantoea sp. 18069 TaxID=2681415 RepID=UPI00135B1D47|nr:LacI family DNA-binding transcriptional regulator [Pantoea sp. 18069]
MSVTLADVARVAGVSKMTVSRALGNPGIVSEATLKRVQDAIARTGYVQNILAGAFRSNRTRLITCLVPTIGAGSVFMDAVQSMSEEFKVAGYQVILGQCEYDAADEEQLVEGMLARRPEGLVLMGPVHSAKARRRLGEVGIPLVEAWAMAGKPIDSMVGFSHEQVGRDAARYLFSKERRRIAVIATDEPRGILREQGFIKAARKLGLTGRNEPVPHWRCPTPSRLRHGRQGAALLLDAHPDIDAIFCATDLVALGVLIEARSRGLAVPRQLAVVGFGDADFAVDTDPSLTTVRVDSQALGRRVAAVLIDRIEGVAEAGYVEDVGFTLIERDSA